jgi:hypothetical protein
MERSGADVASRTSCVTIFPRRRNQFPPSRSLASVQLQRRERARMGEAP